MRPTVDRRPTHSFAGKTSGNGPAPPMMGVVSAALTPLRVSLLAVVLVVGAFAYMLLRSGWVEVDERQFDRRVLEAPRPALVYFDTAIGCRGGDWVFRTLRRRWRGALEVFYVNSVEQRRLAERYGVRHDVVFVLFERGREVKRVTAPEVIAVVTAKNNGSYSDEIFLTEMEIFANVRH